MTVRPFRRRPSRRRRGLAGYTIIEVVMAIGVLTAGAVGIMALQSAATRGNLGAREMSTGTQLAQRWIERLRRDRLSWITSSNSSTVDPTLLANTTYLQNAPPPGDAPAWFVPTPAVSGEAANFDFYGRDTAVEADMHYCTNIRLQWLYPGRAMRADVRVWWVRRVSGSAPDDGADELYGCAPDLDPADLTGDFRVRMVHASTVLRYVATR